MSRYALPANLIEEAGPVFAWMRKIPRFAGYADDLEQKFESARDSPSRATLTAYDEALYSLASAFMETSQFNNWLMSSVVAVQKAVRDADG